MTFVNEIYDSVVQSALIRSEGNQRDADYLMDCSYHEYYMRCAQNKQYQEAMKAHYEAANKKTA